MFCRAPDKLHLSIYAVYLKYQITQKLLQFSKKNLMVQHTSPVDHF